MYKLIKNTIISDSAYLLFTKAKKLKIKHFIPPSGNVLITTSLFHNKKKLRQNRYSTQSPMFGISSQVSQLAGVTYRALYPTLQFLSEGC